MTAQEISMRLQVPFFVRCSQDGQESGSSTTFHLLPPQSSLTRAFGDIIRSKRWKNYALIYEKNQGEPAVSFFVLSQHFLHRILHIRAYF